MVLLMALQYQTYLFIYSETYDLLDNCLHQYHVLEVLNYATLKQRYNPNNWHRLKTILFIQSVELVLNDAMLLFTGK